MDVTFLIGNGFDVGMGLDTRYSDFYKTLSEESKNRIEKDIAEKTSSSDENDRLFWKDYELGLGDATTMYNEKEFSTFKKDKSELDHKISEFIKLESEKYIDDYIAKNYKKMADNIVKFRDELKPTQKDTLSSVIGSSEINFRFISFNYTNVLDKYINAINADKTREVGRYKFSIPLHIHGELANGYIIALDNATQIKNPKMSENSDMLNYLIKSKINYYLGEKRTSSAERIINNSNIICIFGMSLGETDLMWWKKISDWLVGSNKYLVIYDYDKNAEYLSGSDYVDYVTTVRHRFLKASTYVDKNRISMIYEKIFVIHNSDIFNFKKPEEKDNG